VKTAHECDNFELMMGVGAPIKGTSTCSFAGSENIQIQWRHTRWRHRQPRRRRRRRKGQSRHLLLLHRREHAAALLCRRRQRCANSPLDAV
jgi:hypothetical protein